MAKKKAQKAAKKAAKSKKTQKTPKKEGSKAKKKWSGKKEESAPKKVVKKKEYDENLRHIVRIAGKDVDGTLSIIRALRGIKGVGQSFAHIVALKATTILGVKPTQMIGKLDEKQSAVIEDVVVNPDKHNIPLWIYNRRKDYVSGKTIHLTGHELDFAIREDKGRHQKSKSYKGVRYPQGLTVRGQRTRTSGRKNATVGVQRKKK